MTLRTTGAMFMILAASTIPAGLTGCWYEEGPTHAISAASDGRTDTGAVRIARMGGEVDVTDAPHGADLSTMGGNIHLGDVASFAKVKTMGGEIAIDHAKCSVDAMTMGGGINIGHVEGAVKAKTMGGDITARMVATSTERRDVELTSLGGSVTLTVPKDFPMDVRITLAYTKNAPRTYEIVDHVGLEQRETTDWDSSFGSPRKYIRAQGRVGNGLNRVTINVTNGDVILKQE